jgi:phospholipase A-2-activating protein
VLAPDAFATCSRDGTVRVWREAIGSAAAFAQAAVCVGHESFVTALARSPTTGALASGSRDKRVVLWNPADGSQIADLRGHALDVTAVCAPDAPAGVVVSGAMDKSIRVWDPTAARDADARTSAVAVVENAHESSVLALLALPAELGGGFLSASADRTIKRWALIDERASASGKNTVSVSCVATHRGHSDTVRGLASAPAAMVGGEAGAFLSASHDCTARLWRANGDTVRAFVGHAALVYAVAAVSERVVVTGSEDNAMKLWTASDGACVKTIAHPGCVWSVAVIEPLGDVVSCCADGVARVWTADAAKADAGAEAAFDASVASAIDARAKANLAEQQSKIKTEGPEALNSPGASDGATKVIREEGTGAIVAYAWSAGTLAWERLGEVTGVGGDNTEAGGGKKTLDGVAYDYVFDVDIQEGAPTLKLPFNAGDNPYDAAERFLESNGLDPGYREQVVNFIVQNVGERNVQQGANVDPFTGGGAYVPGGGGGGFGAAGIDASSGANADPFTGAGAYVPGGGSRSNVSAANADEGSSSFAYAPHKAPVTFASAKFEPMLEKLLALPSAASDPATADAFRRCVSDASGGEAAGADAMRAFADAADAVAAESAFPVLDLARMLVISRGGGGGASVAAAVAAVAAALRACADAEKTSAASLLTAGRLLCNGLAAPDPDVRDAFRSAASQLLVRASRERRPFLGLFFAGARLFFSRGLGGPRGSFLGPRV